MCIAGLSCVFYKPKDKNKNDWSKVITVTQAANPFLPTFARTSQGNTIDRKKRKARAYKNKRFK